MPEEIETSVRDILSKIEPDAFMTKFVVLIEALDADGERALYTSVNEGSRAWDSVGMLDYALEMERRHLREC